MVVLFLFFKLTSIVLNYKMEFTYVKKDNSCLPFFSIIMPVYNSEKYLYYTINSVLKQSFQNFELLLVDDCSTDHSVDICTQFAASDPRVVLIHTLQNSGAAAARNVGLTTAKGQYIGFVDSDDTIDLDLFQSAYEVLRKKSYDCLKFGCKEEYYNEKNELQYIKVCQLEEKTYRAGHELYNQIIDMEAIPLFGYLCNGFYKRELIKKNHIQLDETLKVNEDFAFNIQFFQFVQNLVCIPATGYHYAKRINGSLTNQHQAYAYDVQMMKIKGLLNFYQGKIEPTPEEKQKIFWMYTRFAYALLSGVKHDKINNMLMQIEKDPLYQEFISVKFRGVSVKQRILIDLLKSDHKLILKVVLSLIQSIQQNHPVLFAKIKR